MIDAKIRAHEEEKNSIESEKQEKERESDAISVFGDYYFVNDCRKQYAKLTTRFPRQKWNYTQFKKNVGMKYTL